jgi:amino acid adenylation domain-containing protein
MSQEDAAAFAIECMRHGVRFTRRGDALKISAPKGSLDDATFDALRSRKADLLAVFEHDGDYELDGQTSFRRTVSYSAPLTSEEISAARTPDLIAALGRRGVQFSKNGTGVLELGIPSGAVEPEAMPSLRSRIAETAAMLDADGKYATASYAQQRMWFLAQMLGAKDTYNVPFAMTIRPDAVPFVERALTEIARRDESLRTTFRLVGGLVLQHVHPSAAASVCVTDLSGDTNERDALEKQLDAFARRSFDLERGPLATAALFVSRGGDATLAINLHHIVTDGASIAILRSELDELLDACTNGREDRLPAIARHYVDFAAEERVHLTNERIENHLRYWREQLRDIPPEIELPLDHPRQTDREPMGGNASRRMAMSAADLRSRVAPFGVTLFQAGLAAFQILLARYTGQSDIVTGIPVSERAQTEGEDLIGLYVNTCVIRSRIAEERTSAEVLQSVRASVAGALAHQELPFDVLVERLAPARGLDRQPLFQVMFSVNDMVATEGGQIVGPLRWLRLARPKFDLSLSLAARGDELTVQASYPADLFDPETIDRLLTHYERLLIGMLAEPFRAIRDLPLLVAEERRELFDAWSGRQLDVGTATVPRLFERCVREQPQAIAVLDDGGAHSYEELDRRANHIANALCRHGIRAEKHVGILMKRGVSAIAAMLGVLKSGGAYVPLDPDDPDDKLQWIGADANIEVLITPEPANATWWKGPMIDARADESDAAPSIEQHHNQLMSVIYTSDSTGRPKGVAVECRSVMNLIAWRAETYRIGKGTRCSQAVELALDAAVPEIYTCLSRGGTLCVMPDEIRLDAAAMLDWLSANSIDVCQLTTPIAEQVLLERHWPPALRKMTLITGGDRLRSDAIGKLPVALFNHYGATEVSVDATSGRVLATDDDPPIGQPAANIRVYILDRDLRPVPKGIIGELYVGGAGVTRGYVGQPGATSERFLPDPFSAVPGSRMYATGDRARTLNDGRIALVGRMETQAKLRGFRIDLGEIETLLSAHRAVRHAVVIAREERLLAYVVAKGKESDLAAQLRSYLEDVLPPFMIPAAIVEIDALPLTANGKVDVRALPAAPLPAGDAPAENRPERDEARALRVPTSAAPPAWWRSAEGYVEPRDIKERVMATMWSGILGVRQVGVTDDFFAIGGHSLAMMQVISKVRDAFDVELPVAIFYARPTIESVLAYVRRAQKTPMADAARHIASSASEHAIAVTMNGSEGDNPLICIHSTGGHLVEFRALAEALHAHRQPVIGLQAPGLADDRVSLTSVEEIARVYSDEILRIGVAGPYRLIGYCVGGVIALAIALELRRRGRTVSFLGVIEGVPEGVDSLRQHNRESTAAETFAGEFKVSLSLSDAPQFANEEQRIAYLWRVLRQQAPESAGMMDYSVFRRLFRVYTSILLAANDYVAPRYDGTLTLFEAKFRRNMPSVAPRWQAVARDLTVFDLEGNHLTIMRDPYVRMLATRIAESLRNGEQTAERRT